MLQDNDRISIVGASGAGKSTLLHIMGSLDEPTSGTIDYHGKNLRTLKGNDLAQWRNKKIGFIFQFHHLLPEFSVLENVALPLIIRGAMMKEAKAKADQLLGELGLGKCLHSQPAALSGGEQQRVAVARALVGEPEILLADEPTGNLDRDNGEQVMELIFRCQQDRKCALVIVTHNEAIAAACPRRLLMVDGRLQS